VRLVVVFYCGAVFFVGEERLGQRGSLFFGHGILARLIGAVLVVSRLIRPLSLLACMAGFDVLTIRVAHGVLAGLFGPTGDGCLLAVAPDWRWFSLLLLAGGVFVHVLLGLLDCGGAFPGHVG
jgi:hypothetical protein